MCAPPRAVWPRYLTVSPSIGKKPMVAPYSGALLARVARSDSGSEPKPGPKYSTKLPTKPWARSRAPIDSTSTGAVTPGRSRPAGGQAGAEEGRGRAGGGGTGRERRGAEE